MNDRSQRHESTEAGSKSKPRNDAGMTLMEVMVAFVIMAITVTPMAISIGGARKRVRDGQTRRVLKQLLEYKLAHILLDKPAEDEEPIYVDGVEGNFGDDFAGDMEKSFWFDDQLYYFNYRVSAEEIDLGGGGGITGEEDDAGFENRSSRENENNSENAGGSPFGGLGEDEEEEQDLGQIRYRVTLFVSFRPGSAIFDRHMSLCTYVRHPHGSEAMQGPDLGESGGGANGIGSGEAGAAMGNTTNSGSADSASAVRGSSVFGGSGR